MHNLSSLNLTGQDDKFQHALTQRTSIPESSVKRPIKCESPDFDANKTPERQGINADLHLVTKKNDDSLRTTMYIEKGFTPGDSSDHKRKRPSLIG